jgi:serine/threonine-protein kinase
MIAGRYRVVGLLGSGGMGEVYRADDLTLGQSVALKFLAEALSASPERRELFVSEARTAREVAHPNVCRVYDIGEAEGQTFLSMEYVDGEDLSSLLRRIGRLPGEKAVEIARQLCAGLAALHDRGLLHRDLKPSNVMVDGRGRVRITDFGLAVPVATDAGKQRVGTPAYMAPEQLDGRGVDARSDVYSLGLVLYEIFTGRRAFEAETMAELARLQREGTPTSPSSIITDLDPAVERILARCLEKDPADRPPSAIAVAAALPGGDPIAAALAAGEIPSLEMVAQAGKRGGVSPAAGAACVAAVIAGIALYATVNVRSKIYYFESPPKPPAVLQDRAAEMLVSIGWKEPPADRAFGFAPDGEVVEYVQDDSASAGRWSSLGTTRPGAVRFWYRHSPEGMVPMETRGTVGPGDPPRTVPGMLDLWLDASGRLLALDAVPNRTESPGDSAATVDWGPLFAAADLDFAVFRETTPEWVPEAFADARAAWLGTFRGQAEPEIRVEAAAYRGRPVFFRVVGPWTPDPAETPDADLADRVFVAAILLLMMAVFFGGAFLAIRNVRLGRGDQAGARKISLLLFVAMCVVGELAAHHAGALDDQINKFFERTASSLFVGALMWLFYLALEPYARRTWPEQMVSWSRLITGRWRDPLVGRDILAGGVFFLFNVAVDAAVIALRSAKGTVGTPDGIQWLVLGALGPSLGWVAGWFVNALFYALFILLFLIFLRILLRNHVVAMVAYAAIVAAFTYFGSSADAKVVGAIHGVVVGVAWAFVLFRLGLVTFTVGMFFRLMMSNYPITLNPSVWWSWTSFLVIGIILAVTLFGLRIALSVRPAFRTVGRS